MAETKVQSQRAQAYRPKAEKRGAMEAMGDYESNTLPVYVHHHDGKFHETHHVYVPEPERKNADAFVQQKMNERWSGSRSC